MKRTNKRSRFLASAVTILIGALMTVSLIISAGAIAPNFSVSNYSTDPGTTADDVPVTSLTAGQVWTGKSVTELDRASGSFNITLSALGGAQGAGALITSDGLVFNDAYDANYGFVISGDNIPFYLDGAASATEAVPQGGGVYTASGAGWSVAFDTVAGTVVYKVTALKTVTTPVSAALASDAFNSVRFGVVLKDSAAAAATYRTNPPNCTVTYSMLQTNSDYIQSSDTKQYVNSEKWEEYIPTTIGTVSFSRDPLDIYAIKLDNKYAFYYDSDPEKTQLGFNPTKMYDTDGLGPHEGPYYDVWIIRGGYTFGTDELEFGTATTDYHMRYYINNPPSKPAATMREGDSTMKKLVTTTQFSYAPIPVQVGDNVTVTAGGVDYVGQISVYNSSASWSLTSGSSVVTLVDANTLTVTTTTGQLVNTTTPVSMSHTHNAYGTVTIEANQVAGASDAAVLGESDILPQTDGVSVATLIGIGGIALIAIGGTAFVVFRKKFLN